MAQSKLCHNDAFRFSHLSLLEQKDILHTVLQFIPADEAFFVALVCKPFRDGLYDRGDFQPRTVQPLSGKRFVTTVRAVGHYPERIKWVGPVLILPRNNCLRAYFECTGKSCADAAKNGYLTLLKFMRTVKNEKGEIAFKWDVRTCSSAAKAGHLQILKWARTNGCNWCWLTCSYAAGAGHLDMLQWARTNGCPWNETTCTMAAKGGHLNVLKWARAHGCPWDEETCLEAANNGHLMVLQWARANGCDWNWFKCYQAGKYYYESFNDDCVIDWIWNNAGV